MHFILFYIIPGFIFLRIQKKDAAERGKDQWPFILEASVVSTIFFVLARMIVSILNYILNLCPELSEKMHYLWGYIFPLEFSFTLFIATISAVFVAKLGFLDKYTPSFIYEKDNAFAAFMNDMISEPLVMVETKSKKIYIGQIEQHSFDESLIINPFFSGVRREKDVLYNIWYFKDKDKLESVRIFLQKEEVITIRPFNWHMFEDFVSDKVIILENIPDFLKEKK